MDAETIDAYVEATADESREVLFEALRRLARAHEGPYRPAPAKVIDRCYVVKLEQRDVIPRHRQLEMPKFRADLEERIAVWQKCIDGAVVEGVPETSGRLRFWLRGIERLRVKGIQGDTLAEIFD